MAHDVFISYSVEDKPTADAVCAALEGKRIRCWIAPRDILPGAIFAEALIEAINGSRVFVLVFSSRSNNSPHVMRELERAVHKGLPILPLRIEDVPLSLSMEYFISSPHWLDAMTPPLQKHLGHLAETVRLLLTRTDEAAAEAAGAVATAVVEPATGPGRPGPAPARQAVGGGRLTDRPAVRAAAILGVVGVALAVTFVVATLPRNDPTALVPTATPPAAARTGPPTYPGGSITSHPPTSSSQEPSSRTPRPSPTEEPSASAYVAFRAPEASGGMAWDGTDLWFTNSGTMALYRTDPEGNVLDLYASTSFQKTAALTWDGAAFWAFALDSRMLESEIVHFTLDRADPAQEPRVLDAFGLTVQPNPIQLAWDGTQLWVPGNDALYNLSATGERVRIIPFNTAALRGLTWDGDRLWIASGSVGGTTLLTAMDVEGRTLFSVSVPIFALESLTGWDGQLWAVGSDLETNERSVYRIEVQLPGG